MILILSDDLDYSTNQVIDWILYFKEEFVRINPTNDISIEEINFDENKEKIVFKTHLHDGKTVTIDTNDISSYWYRRGCFRIADNYLSSSETHNVVNELNAEIKSQNKTMIDFVNFFFKSKMRYLGSYEDNNTNKLTNLHIAKSVGLEIPDSRILNSKSSVLEFLNKNGNLISKPASQGSAFGFKSNLNGLTVLIDEVAINEFEEEFFPTFFQECLQKEFELRCFYLDGEIYSMAIFSQNDEQTQVDFRNYNVKKPNRTIPFELPETEKDKLVKFMNAVNMNCGSIDVIYTKDKKFVFLEVNPVGQFHQLSYPCNYHVEKKIAEYLINN